MRLRQVLQLLLDKASHKERFQHFLKEQEQSHPHNLTKAMPSTIQVTST
jgi:hypothetical protein